MVHSGTKKGSLQGEDIQVSSSSGGLWNLCLNCMVSSSIGTCLPSLERGKDSSNSLWYFGNLSRFEPIFRESDTPSVGVYKYGKLVLKALKWPAHRDIQYCYTETFNTVNTGCWTQLNWTQHTFIPWNIKRTPSSEIPFLEMHFVDKQDDLRHYRKL